MLRVPAWVVVVCLAGCRDCGQGLVASGPAVLTATPASLVFPDTWEQETSTLRLEVANVGGEPATVTPEVTAPFFVDATPRELARGQTLELEVRFTAPPPGSWSATLAVGSGLRVPLQAVSLAKPACEPSSACVERLFDLATGTCVEARRDGQPCATRCTVGQCVGDVCVGETTSCDDGDACTVDACDDSAGCRHVARECPALPCQAGRCVADAGCVFTPVEDGVRCGVDDCDALTAEVCIAGECVERARPAVVSCTARWIPLAPKARRMHSLAWDPLRKRVVLYGGLDATLWEWDGQRWRDRVAHHPPPARLGAGLAFDGQALVLFGGVNSMKLADTWSWNGLDWVARHPAVAPGPRVFHSMVWQPARGQVLLFGGLDRNSLRDTWEWDGQTWRERHPATSPPARSLAALAWDEARQEAVLFGGDSDVASLGDTWTWDGSTWTQRFPLHSPPARHSATLTWDGARRRLVLNGGGVPGAATDDEWEWDGVDWTPRVATFGPRSDAAATWDPVRGEAVLFGGSDPQTDELADTWVRRQGRWTRAVEGSILAFRALTRLAADHARRRVVLFGGGWAGLFDDTWEWDGREWHERTPAHRPSPRIAHAMTWDSVRQRTVLFGGRASITDFGDTWEWDGTDWSLRAVTPSPAARAGAAMAFDELRGRVVLFGGLESSFARDDTWEWDGARWVPLPTTTRPPARGGHAMAWDPQLQRVVLMGGSARAGTVFSDLWAWDGAQWTELRPPFAPPARSAPVLATDLRAGDVVLVGGGITDTWDWTGGAWHQPTLATIASEVAAAAWDPSLQRVVAWGGGTLWVLSR